MEFSGRYRCIGVSLGSSHVGVGISGLGFSDSIGYSA